MVMTSPGKSGNTVLCITLWVCIWIAMGQLIAGCGPKVTEPINTKGGGVLYVGIEVPFHGFDILSQGALNPPQAPLNNLILEPLFRRDATGSLVPILGVSATPTVDGKAWDIKLRKGVSFHDGTPFNAGAVVHHWTRMLDPTYNFRGRRLLKPIQRIEKTGEFSVQFILAHPWPAFINIISNELALLAFIPSPKAVDAETHGRQPVGTGPFKYKDWRGGTHFIVLKNHQYWQKGKPLLDKVVFRTVPDPQTRYASLVAGQLDIVFLDRGHLIKKAQDDSALFTHKIEGNGAEIILMNTRKPPLDDIRVRRALALANNQELHVKMVYGNTISLVHHPFGQWSLCDDDGYLNYDPRKAKEMIAAYGRPVELGCIHSNTSRGRQIGELQQQLFKKIGVKLTPNGMSPPAHMAKVMGADYDLATWRIPPSADHGPRLFNSFYSKSPINITGYSNPDMDRLLEQQRVETDPTKREGMLCEIIRQLNRDVPFLYRGGRGYHIIAGKKIRDMLDTPGFHLDLASAWIEDPDKFNVKALQIEIDSAPAPGDCTPPENPEARKAEFIGTWQGKTSFGVKIRLTFDQSDKLAGVNVSENRTFSRKISICGSDVVFFARNGVKVTASVSEKDKQKLILKYITWEIFR